MSDRQAIEVAFGPLPMPWQRLSETARLRLAIQAIVNGKVFGLTDAELKVLAYLIAEYDVPKLIQLFAALPPFPDKWDAILDGEGAELDQSWKPLFVYLYDATRDARGQYLANLAMGNTVNQNAQLNAVTLLEGSGLLTQTQAALARQVVFEAAPKSGETVEIPEPPVSILPVSPRVGRLSAGTLMLIGLALFIAMRGA